MYMLGDTFSCESRESKIARSALAARVRLALGPLLLGLLAKCAARTLVLLLDDLSRVSIDLLVELSGARLILCDFALNVLIPLPVRHLVLVLHVHLLLLLVEALLGREG